MSAREYRGRHEARPQVTTDRATVRATTTERIQRGVHHPRHSGAVQ